MNSQEHVEGVVVILEGEVVRGLRHLAKKRSFSILEVEAADQALKHIQSVRPCVIVVQVEPDRQEAMRFIRKAKTATRRVPLIAAAVGHTAALEREVLRAGASAYVPGASSGLLNPLLEAVLTSDREK